MNKEKYIKEVEIAFEIYELLKNVDPYNWHRVWSVIENIKNEQFRLNEGYAKEAYLKGRPVGVE